MSNEHHNIRPAKRPKIRLACQECRDRKIRCDGGRPVCASCIRKGLSADNCVYSEPGLASTAPEYVRLLEDRIQDLERRLLQSGDGICEPEPVQSLAPLISPVQQFQSENQPSAQRGHHVASTPSSLRISLAPAAESQPIVEAISTQAPKDPSSSLQMSTWQSPHPTNVQINHEGSTNQDEESTMGARIAQDDMSSRTFLGRSSVAAFLDEVRNKHGSPIRRRPAASDDSSPQTNNTNKSMSTKDQVDLASLLHQLVLPPRQVADAHLRTYWKHFYPFNPILHKASFQKSYEEIWALKNEHADLETSVHSVRAFHSLLNIIMALGCLFPQTDGAGAGTKSNGDLFFDRSQRLQSQASLDHASLTLVQAHALTAQYLSTTGMVNRCWVTLGVAIRTAQGIGIHLDLPSETQAGRQERRRTWWYCVQMDRVFGMVYGRPPMVLWPSGIPHPDIVDDDTLSVEPCSAAHRIQNVQMSEQAYFVWSLRLSDILLDILKVLYPNSTADKFSGQDINTAFRDCNQLVELDSRLSTWKSNLPQILAFDSEADLSGDGPFRREATYLHSRFLHLRILLFRPVIADLARETYSDGYGYAWTDFQYSVAFGCAKACISAAQELISVLYKRCMNRNGRPSHWWFAVFYLFTAGTVILAFRSSSRLAVLQQDVDSQMERSWVMTLEALSTFERHGNVFARRCLWILATSCDQISGTSPDRTGDDAEPAPSSDPSGRNQPLQPPGTHNPTDMLLTEDLLADRLWASTGLDWLNGIPGFEGTETEGMVTYSDIYIESTNI